MFGKFTNLLDNLDSGFADHLTEDDSGDLDVKDLEKRRKERQARINTQQENAFHGSSLMKMKNSNSNSNNNINNNNQDDTYGISGNNNNNNNNNSPPVSSSSRISEVSYNNNNNNNNNTIDIPSAPQSNNSIMYNNNNNSNSNSNNNLKDFDNSSNSKHYNKDGNHAAPNSTHSVNSSSNNNNLTTEIANTSTTVIHQQQHQQQQQQGTTPKNHNSYHSDEMAMAMGMGMGGGDNSHNGGLTPIHQQNNTPYSTPMTHIPKTSVSGQRQEQQGGYGSPVVYNGNRQISDDDDDEEEYNTTTTTTTTNNTNNNLQAEVKKLKKETKNLNIELDEMEARLEGQNKELLAAGEALRNATLKAAVREDELMEEMNSLKKAKLNDKGKISEIMVNKDKMIANLTGELEDVNIKKTTLETQVNVLRNDMYLIMQENTQCKEDLEIAKENQDRGADTLRSELQGAEGIIKDIKEQHKISMKTAHQREVELEETVAELTQSLARTQREFETQKTSLRDMGSDSHVSDLEVHRLQQEISATQSSLELERQHVYSLQREVRTLQQENSVSSMSWKEEKRNFEDKLERAIQEVQKYKQEGIEAKKLLDSGTVPQNEEMEKRIKSISEQLVKKQIRVDEVKSEKYALESRLRSAFQRAEKAETQLAEYRNGIMGSSGYYDMETGTMISNDKGYSSSNRSGNGMRQRKAGGVQAISVLEPIAKNPAVAKAVDMVDKLCITAGYYLKINPFLRLIFIIYFMLLHLWGFCIIVFHTHITMDDIHDEKPGGNFVLSNGMARNSNLSP